VASLLLPTYVLLEGELTGLREEVAANTASANTFDTNTTALTAAVAQARLLIETKSVTPFTLYEAQLTAVAGEAVKLSSIEFIREATTTRVTLSGVADTRIALANFKDNLEAEPLFGNVVLPIASLIRDRDLEFIMTVTAFATTTP
jgi:hypothetical protein